MDNADPACVMPDAVTEAIFFSGGLHFLQHAAGYRFSVDAVLLAHFCRPRAGARILDLGAGCGVISLIVGYRHPEVTITALELQPALAGLCQRNIELNRLQARVSLREGDMREVDTLWAPESFDWVVCNPPYGKLATGRQNPRAEQAACRHEIHAGLPDVVRTISYSLKTRGRAALVYPARRAAALLAALKNARLEPKRLQIVYSYPGGEGKLALVEAAKNGGEEMTVLPPFFIHEAPGGVYTEAMRGLYQP